MIQNLIALTIVFSAAGYTIFAIIKSFTVKKASHCSGCAGCSFKEFAAIKHAKAMQAGNFPSQNLMLIKNGK